MNQPDLQRWSREVAEDPGAPSFVRLARTYRRQGRGEAARDVVLAGLAANPEHVQAHALLALIHVESGDRQQARDEWETVQRLDPGNFDANRGLGFLALERNDLEAARRHLETARGARPGDPAVRQALQVLESRERGAKDDAPAGTATSTAGPAAAEMAGTAEPPVSAGARSRDPRRLFDPLARETPFLGALVLDEQGLVLAGRLRDDSQQGDLLAALLNTAVSEAGRTARILEIGEWQGLLLEAAEATLHVNTVEGGAVVVVAAPDAPAGWVVRTSARARELATRFMEADG